MADEDRSDSQDLGVVTQIDAVLAQLSRAGPVAVLVVGVVPLAELDVLRLGVFVDAGTASPPLWEGWLSRPLLAQLWRRWPDGRRAAWDAGAAGRWSVAWTDDTLPLVVWTPAGGRLRVADGVVDVLEDGRWTILPVGRVARLSLDPRGGAGVRLRLHMNDGRLVAFSVGHQQVMANLLAARVADALGLDWSADPQPRRP